jgi:hypothetical protein
VVWTDVIPYKIKDLLFDPNRNSGIPTPTIRGSRAPTDFASPFDRYTDIMLVSPGCTE